MSDSSQGSGLPLPAEGDKERVPLFTRLAAAISVWRAKYHERRIERQRRAYVAKAVRWFRTDAADTEEAIKRGKREVEHLRAKFVQKIRETLAAERKLQELQGSRSKFEPHYAKDFDTLLALDKVVKVKIRRRKVLVYTRVLCCVDPQTGLRHEMGAFRISLVSSGKVRFFNKTRWVWVKESSMFLNHPHVLIWGQACLGNTSEIFPELIANHEFAVAAMLAIQFLESVNPDDRGTNIKRWPIAASERGA